VYLVCSIVLFWIAIRMAFSSALRMLCKLGSLSAFWRLLAGQYTPDPIVLPMPFSSRGLEFNGVGVVELYW
jgi:hypothetical protein